MFLLEYLLGKDTNIEVVDKGVDVSFTPAIDVADSIKDEGSLFSDCVTEI